MKTKFAALTCIVAALSSCSDDNVRPDADRYYLPLEVGNYWEFVEKNAPSSGTLTEKREVTGKAVFGDQEYFVLVSTRPTPAGPLNDTSYYRVASNGYAFVYSKYYDREFQNLRLNANDGDSWSFTFNDYETTVSLTDISLELGSETIVNCKNYYIDTRQMADEEYTVILAPGVGFAKEYSNAWGGGQRVRLAKINGVVHEF